MKQILLTMTLLLTAFRTPVIHADEFKAMSGLWKTTLHTQDGATSPTSHVQWQCVVEGENPFVAFARLPVAPHETCTRTRFLRRSTSLQWRLDCAGDYTLTNQGSLNFDAAKHYTGTIQLDGRVMGYPIREVLAVEGSRQAACTSPTD